MHAYPSELIEIELPGTAGQTRIVIPRNELFRLENIFVRKEYGILPNLIPSGPLTVVDIGANIGLFALFMKTVKPECEIICFEPVPQTLKLLRHNLSGHQNIRICPCALSDHSGIARMRLHPTNTGENSILPAGTITADYISVPLLDSAEAFRQIGLTYIDIMKIDTEGCEVEILRSLHDYLPYIGILMLEYHSDSDRRRIDQLLSGYVLTSARAESMHCGTVKYINARLTG